MKEIWKDVVGFEGIYLVSNYGRMKSVDRYDRLGRFTRGRVLKLYTHKDGYFEVVMYKRDCRKRRLVHRVVADAFIENLLNHPEINHKDEDKQNNRADNLEWCNRNYNVNYGTGMARSAITKGKPVIQKSQDGERLHTYPSISCAARAMRTKPTTISALLRGVKGRKTACGYLWEYAQ